MNVMQPLSLSERLRQVQAEIAAAAAAAGRPAQEITLLAVSKTKPVEAVLEAVAAGQRCFGESYCQEAVDKINAIERLLAAPGMLEWHFIGPLQSNKTRPVASHFDWVQSVDRFKIAQRLNAQRPESLPPLNICLQVNISGEASKSGMDTEQVPALAEAVNALPRLKLRGLMAIAEHTGDSRKLANQFSQLKKLYDELRQRYPGIDTLSMGMSGDSALAIAHGSTMVRIGTAIFGQRNYSDE